MKKSVKILSIFAAIVMILTMITPLTVFAETSGDFEYIVLENGTADILHYNGSAAELDIPSEIDGYVVSCIDFMAFSDCFRLAKVTIPACITSIEQSAFNNCENLISITVDKNNKYYSNDESGVLFSKDKSELIQYPIGSSRTEYVIPDSVRYINNSAFSGCRSLTGITIPGNVTNINYGVFSGCSGLYDITIPDGVTSIGDYAFFGCGSLRSITIPENVVKIGNYAFSDCGSLTGITVDGNNRKYSSDESGVLFDKTKTELIQYPAGNSRTEYTIPESATRIGNSAFFGSGNLISIIIPDSVSSIGSDVFESSALSDNSAYWENGVLYIDGRLVAVDKMSLESEYTVKDGTRLIADKAFYGCETLESVTIPDSVTIIGESAFEECVRLKDITIGNGVKRIGAYAFSDTWLDHSEYWEDGVLYIGDCLISADRLFVRSEYAVKDGTRLIADYAFQRCSGLYDITIPDSVIYIGDNAFYHCSDLKSITIPDSVVDCSSDEFGVLFNKDKTQLILYPGGNDRMQYCIPKSVTSIGNDAFFDCLNLTSITIPENVTDIGSFAFTYCKGLTEITIPEGITDIGENMFSFCRSLANINLPDSVTTIGDSAFYMCSGLKNIAIPDSVTNIGESAFYGCDSLSNITIGGNVEKISNCSFGFCKNLESVIISDSVSDIGMNAFTNCSSLSNIMIPVSVKSINPFAFDGCVNLTDVYYGGTQGQWNSVYIGAGNSALKSVRIHISTIPDTTDETQLMAKSDSGINIFMVNGVLIAQIAAGQSIESIIALLENENVRIINNGGEFVGSGSTIEILNNVGNVTAEYTVLVAMDINGDGRISAADARLLLRVSARLETLNGVYGMAANTNSDGRITSFDARKILRVSAKLEKA